jgi:hypothetical protein
LFKVVFLFVSIMTMTGATDLGSLPPATLVITVVIQILRWTRLMALDASPRVFATLLFVLFVLMVTIIIIMVVMLMLVF